MWPSLSQVLRSVAIPEEVGAKPERGQGEVLDEILSSVRVLSGQVNSIQLQQRNLISRENLLSRQSSRIEAFYTRKHRHALQPNLNPLDGDISIPPPPQDLRTILDALRSDEAVIEWNGKRTRISRDELGAVTVSDVSGSTEVIPESQVRDILWGA